MKILKYLLVPAAIIAVIAACDEGIDPITAVPPGDDTASPTVNITYPAEGTLIRVKEEVTPIDIRFEVLDDIEIQTITVQLDGTSIAEYSDFKDYRRALQSYRYESLTNGPHTLTITATDLSGKSTSEAVAFEKVEPYQPIYDGEIFYMPFDDEILELISITQGTAVGAPGYVPGKVGKALRFDAASKSYLLFPSDAVSAVNSFSVSFWTRPEFVDSDSDGGIDGILGLVNFSNVSGFWGNLDWFVENGSNPSSALIKAHVTNGNGGETWIEVPGVTNFFGEWTHHVLAYDATAEQFVYYIDAVPVATVAAGWDGTMAFANGGPMVFGTVHFMTNPSLTTGSGAQGWASYLTGGLDEVRMFNKGLTQEEVETIYNDAQ